jgi:hypothetical protein
MSEGTSKRKPEKAKNVRVQLTVETTVRVPANWTAESIRFHVEERMCVEDLIDKLHSKMKPGVCNLCAFATVKVLPGGKAQRRGAHP